ncbi:MAG: aminopeptidase, partial [Chlamydiia bacterium]|nr:aminopeptidase [Chlamydiia bacterium]
MQFEALKSLAQCKAADVLVLPFWKGKKTAEAAAVLGALEKDVKHPAELGDFTGKEGDTALLYCAGRKEKRVVLLGLGEQDKVDIERLRRAYGTLGGLCRKLKAKTLNILPPQTKMNEETVVTGICEGLLLTNYAFEEHRGQLEEPAVLLSKAGLVGVGKSGMAKAKHVATVCEGVYQARNLTNRNADEVTPSYLAELAKRWGQEFSTVKTTVFNKARIEKEKMGLLLA